MGYCFVFASSKIPKGERRKRLEGIIKANLWFFFYQNQKRKKALMAFRITDFIAATKDGLAREAYFDAEIPLPATLISRNGSQRSNKLSELCVAANIPVKQAEVVEYKRFGTGLRTAYVTGMRYSVLDLTFYCDAKSEVIRTVQDWLDSMFNYSVNGQLSTVEYKDNYTSKITVNQYDPGTNWLDASDQVKNSRKPVVTYTFNEAFPYLFGPVNFSWGSRNNLILVPVSFVYTDYTMSKNPKSTVTNPSTTNITSQNNRLPATGVTNLFTRNPLTDA